MMRNAITLLILIGVFGILVPLYRSYDFLDPVMLTAYFLMPVVMVAPVAASALAGSAESVGATVVPVLRVAFYGWALGIAIVAAGLITVNAGNWHRHLLLPPGQFLGAEAFLSAAACLAAAVVTGLFAHVFSVRAARTIVRLLFLAVLVAIVLLVRGASTAWVALSVHLTTAELTRAGWYAGAVLMFTDAVALGAFARLRRAG